VTESFGKTLLDIEYARSLGWFYLWTVVLVYSVARTHDGVPEVALGPVVFVPLPFYAIG